jgi:hypothetical protein
MQRVVREGDLAARQLGVQYRREPLHTLRGAENFSRLPVQAVRCECSATALGSSSCNKTIKQPLSFVAKWLEAEGQSVERYEKSGGRVKWHESPPTRPPLYPYDIVPSTSQGIDRKAPDS